MPTEEEVDAVIEKLRREQEPRGYHLNPDEEDLRVIIEGYLVNQERFGYPACPCRLGSGNRDEDLDIICPCDYRDDDVAEHGACYCSLYVDEDIAGGRKEPAPVPERRPPEEERKKAAASGSGGAAAGGSGTGGGGTPVPTVAPGGFAFTSNVWRCPVCGYLCAKDQPPPKCPICGVSRDRFELFIKAA
jgi:ferredoxin-thioredoxin reductase catalytic subunit